MLFSNYSFGAGLATDLVNTSAIVWTSAGEVLTDPAALARFLDEHEARLDALPGGALPTGTDLAQVHALRQETRALLAAEHEDEVARGANELAARASAAPALLRNPAGEWEWQVTTDPSASVADELGALVGIGLLGVLHTLSHARFRHCASPVCAGMFVDTSKAGRRRYCMPGLCGNRLNVANYRARHQGGAARPGDGSGTGAR
ncbi:CGNR zinc finger domain-containing protein [Streptomyces corynorhini]|uniref:CGNR zinc finger domain-containing protein n=1 Tax=Streptomyces corynorhini TaxID=2282652 RepID=UPI001F2BA287|nr:CGNR zinc finger domain-containing protein [Streptomyces corynorhini]